MTSFPCLDIMTDTCLLTSPTTAKQYLRLSHFVFYCIQIFARLSNLSVILTSSMLYVMERLCSLGLLESQTCIFNVICWFPCLYKDFTIRLCEYIQYSRTHNVKQYIDISMNQNYNTILTTSNRIPTRGQYQKR